jgi:hypothetical protein
MLLTMFTIHIPLLCSYGRRHAAGGARQGKDGKV